MKHDGKPHTYKITFTAAHPVTAVRLDPGQTVGTIHVSAMTLRGKTESVPLLLP